VNPFDLKSTLLAKHAQHVVLVHFPIALFMAGVGFDIAAGCAKRTVNRAALACAARLNMLAAAAFVLPTLASGVLAWQWQLEGKKLKGLLLLHLVLGSSSGMLICLTAWMGFRHRRASGFSRPTFCLIIEVLTAAVVALTAHIGGFLSGVNISG